MSPLEVFSAGNADVHTFIMLDPEIDKDESRHVVGRTMKYIGESGKYKKKEVKMNIVTYVK